MISYKPYAMLIKGDLQIRLSSPLFSCFSQKQVVGLNLFMGGACMAHYYQKIVSPWKRTDPKSKTVNTEVFSDEYIEMLKDIQWIGTEKVDGENLNFYYDGNHVSYFGHTDKSVFTGDKKEWLDSLITPEFESIFEQIFGEKEAFVHGELLGPKIQSNLYGVSDFQFYAFDIYNKTDNVFWKQDVVDIYAKQFGFERAPLIATGTLEEIAAIVKTVPASKLNPKIEMEGIVIRPLRELKNAKNERIIYKVKVADLLGRNAGKIQTK